MNEDTIIMKTYLDNRITEMVDRYKSRMTIETMIKCVYLDGFMDGIDYVKKIESKINERWENETND